MYSVRHLDCMRVPGGHQSLDALRRERLTPLHKCLKKIPAVETSHVQVQVKNKKSATLCFCCVIYCPSILNIRQSRTKSKSCHFPLLLCYIFPFNPKHPMYNRGRKKIRTNKILLFLCYMFSFSRKPFDLLSVSIAKYCVFLQFLYCKANLGKPEDFKLTKKDKTWWK